TASPKRSVVPAGLGGVWVLLLVEVPGEQLGEGVEDLLGAVTVGGEDDGVLVLGAEGHDAEDARRVDGVAAGLADLHRDAGLAGGLDVCGWKPGVQPLLGFDAACALGH